MNPIKRHYWNKNIEEVSSIPTDASWIKTRIEGHDYYGRSLKGKHLEKCKIVVGKIIPLFALSIVFAPISIPVLFAMGKYRELGVSIREVHYNTKIERILNLSIANSNNTKVPTQDSLNPVIVDPSPSKPKSDSSTESLQKEESVESSKEESVEPAQKENAYYLDGKEISLKPIRIFYGVPIGKNMELNFVVIESKGSKSLLPVTYSKFGDPKDFQIYQEGNFNALFKIAQGSSRDFFSGRVVCTGSPLKFFLNHENNPGITAEQLVDFLLEDNRICTIDAKSTLEALDLIKENHLNVALDSLFKIWVGKNAEITKKLLMMDPTLIDHVRSLNPSPFVIAALKTNQESAELLLNAMEDRGMPLTSEELWIRRAFKNDCNFSENDFKGIEETLKTKVFYIANAFRHSEIVALLKEMGMGKEPPLFSSDLEMIASNMDYLTAQETISEFLVDLRKKNLLLTKDEFNLLDNSQYIFKGNSDIGRIQGRNFIEKVAKENDLHHIKVPKKMIVMEPGKDTISISLKNSGALSTKDNDSLSIFAERIIPVDRKLSLDEAIELMTVLEKTGYRDHISQSFIERNLFICEDGVYFIDTEYGTFGPGSPDFETIKEIKYMLEDHDVAAFLEEFQRRSAAFDEEQAGENDLNHFDDPYKNLIKACALFPFDLDLKTLLT